MQFTAAFEAGSSMSFYSGRLCSITGTICILLIGATISVMANSSVWTNRQNISKDNFFVINSTSEISEGDFENITRQSSINTVYRGYLIQAWDMDGMSINDGSGYLQILFRTGPIDQAEGMYHLNEIRLNVISQGQTKSARIVPPEGVNARSLTVERTEQSVIVTGPL